MKRHLDLVAGALAVIWTVLLIGVMFTFFSGCSSEAAAEPGACRETIYVFGRDDIAKRSAVCAANQTMEVFHDCDVVTAVCHCPKDGK